MRWTCFWSAPASAQTDSGRIPRLASSRLGLTMTGYGISSLASGESMSCAGAVGRPHDFRTALVLNLFRHRASVRESLPVNARCMSSKAAATLDSSRGCPAKASQRLMMTSALRTLRRLRNPRKLLWSGRMKTVYPRSVTAVRTSLAIWATDSSEIRSTLRAVSGS